MRDVGLKPRDETPKLPPEKLHDILCWIYPKEVAEELYAQLMSNVERRADDAAD